MNVQSMRLPWSLLPALLAAASCGGPTASASASIDPGDDPISQEKLEEMTEVIKAEVEELRGESFQGPVKVAVSSEEEFHAYVLKRLAEMSTPADISADEAAAKLMGLLDPEFDFLARTLALVESQVGGFYDPGSKGFYLMEGFGGGMARIILAHELTHALDDQLFDIDGGLEERKSNSDALWAYHAVVEGSGTAVMNQWTMKNLRSLDMEELQASASMGMDELAEAPGYLWKPLIGSYSKGEAFLRKRTKGMSLPEALRVAFEEPPLSSEQVLHPEKYWDPEERDDPVFVGIDRETLPEGWEVLDEDTMGELQLGLVIEPLDKRGGVDNPMAAMMARLTWKAVKGWGGDRYLLLGRGDDRLLCLATAWDREKDAREFEEAISDLRAHILSGTAGEMVLKRDADRLVVVLANGEGEALAADALGWARFE